MSAPRHGADGPSYITYARLPFGAMAGAEYIERSPGSDTASGAAQAVPPLLDADTRVFSLLNPKRPSLQASMIRLVASAPVGAPLAMSTLGAADRSMRAPA